MVSIYSAAHFLVDFACAFLAFGFIVFSPERQSCILAYNFCAFAMQLPLGIIADRVNKNFLFASLGCALVFLSFGLLFSPLSASVTAGIGNGMFHIGGGIDVLNISGKKSAALGVFVSPGALGLYFGTVLGRGGAFSPFFVMLALFAAALLICVFRIKRGGAFIPNAAFSIKPAASSRALLATVCLFLVVVLRSYVGLTLSFPWKSVMPWRIAAVCAVALGKTLGGFASDRINPYKTSVISLAVAAVLFLVPGYPAAGVLSLLLFNMTMPITLLAIAGLFPGAKGFSFGLLTLALFLGFLPTHLLAGAPAAMPWQFAVSATLSLGLLYAGLKGAKA